MPYDNPPSEFASAQPVGGDVYWMPSPDEDAGNHPTVWHWCTTSQRWQARGTRNHDVLSLDPLHLEPSLLWNCCGKHGWIRNGEWTPA